MATTTYVVSTNNVEAFEWASKARAMRDAQDMTAAAQARGMGDVVTVKTRRTGKIVYTFTAQTTNVRADWETDESVLTAPVTATESPAEPRNPLVGVKLYDHTYRGLCSLSSVSTYMGEVYGDTAESMELCATCEETLDRCANLTRYAEEESVPSVVVAPPALRPVHVPLVGVRQSRHGWQGLEHIHASGCTDIAKEMRRYGQSADDTFRYSDTATLADLVSDNWADVASDTYGNDVMTSAAAWRDMVEWTNDDHSGLKIMPCAKGLDAGVCPAGTLYRASSGYIGISPQSGTVGCSECGSHIMVDDVTMPATCEPGECDYGFAETDAELPAPDMYAVGQALGKSLPVIVPCDRESEADMVDTITDTYTVEAHLAIDVDGVRVDLGWHTFTIENGCEKSIPALYGERHGEWKRPGAANWASVIVVIEQDIY